MFVKNISARLIKINVKGQPTVRLLPGNNPAVELTDEAAKSEFTEYLFKSGQIRKADQSEAVVETEEDEKDQLIADLEELGVDVDARWGVKRLKEELKKAVEDND